MLGAGASSATRLAVSQPPVSTATTRIAILISGRGSNGESIALACRDGRLPGCEIVLVVSNVPGAQGIERLRALGLTTVTLEGRGRDRLEHEEAVASLLRKFRVNLVCLAGYKRVMSPGFVSEWKDRVLNVHPSLLPAFPGMHAQRQAIFYGVQFSGCTVHLVDAGIDSGVILLQHAVEVLDTDSVESLSDRILTEEHVAYVEAIRRLISGEYEVQDRRFVRRGTEPIPPLVQGPDAVRR